MGCLGAYLLFNASPCMLMMGDAGSRAIGLFLGILMLETGNVLLSVPFAVVILLNGGLGLLKLSVMRLFHTKKFMAGLRTPLHDECRKNRGQDGVPLCHCPTAVRHGRAAGHGAHGLSAKN